MPRVEIVLLDFERGEGLPHPCPCMMWKLVEWIWRERKGRYQTRWRASPEDHHGSTTITGTYFCRFEDGLEVSHILLAEIQFGLCMMLRA